MYSVPLKHNLTADTSFRISEGQRGAYDRVSMPSFFFQSVRVFLEIHDYVKHETSHDITRYESSGAPPQMGLKDI